jgi:hypothetical protein
MDERDGTLIANLVVDRGVLKYRINFIKGNRIFGCIKKV